MLLTCLVRSQMAIVWGMLSIVLNFIVTGSDLLGDREKAWNTVDSLWELHSSERSRDRMDCQHDSFLYPLQYHREFSILSRAHSHTKKIFIIQPFYPLVLCSRHTSPSHLLIMPPLPIMVPPARLVLILPRALSRPTRPSAPPSASAPSSSAAAMIATTT